MKKKIFTILIAMSLCLSLFGCGKNETDGSTESDTVSDQSTTKEIENETIDTESTKETIKESEIDPQDEMAYEITYQKARVYKNSIGTTWIQTIIEITNTGSSSLYLSSGSYDLEDESGNLIANRTMISAYPQIIESGEKGYYYEETTLDNDLGDTQELTVIPRPDIEEASIAKIDFPITDFELSADNYGDIKMLGRVENTSSEAQGMVYIVAILYDANNEPIGQIFTILTDDLMSGDKIGFEASALSLPDNVALDSIAKYKTFAYPHQYQF